ncbi:MAG: formylglycine-generating enzyme family protein, partial [bacterium]|nr:formylglycine-generating enzyme family protein [bacterium]
MNARIWRGDLVRIHDAVGPEVAGAAARLIGFTGPSADRDSSARTVQVEADAVPLPQWELPEVVDADLPLWRLDRFEAPETSDDEPREPEKELEYDPVRSAELRPAADSFPDRVPLEPWPRVWRWVRESARRDLARENVDVPRLVEELSRGRHIRRLPREMRPAPANQLWILVDRGRRLTPFWEDQDRFVARVERAFGPRAVELWVFLDGPGFEPLHRGGMHSKLPPPAHRTPVLLLGDLGGYGSGALQRAWRRYGERLVNRGYRIHALAPCPLERIDDRTARVWKARVWDRGKRVGADRENPVRQLLRLLAPAVRVEPGLLRAARLALSAERADVGTECDVWRHQGVRGSSTGLVLAPELRRVLHRQWAREPAGLRDAVWLEIRRWHAALPPEIGHEEVLGLAAEHPGAVAQDALGAARDFFLRLAAGLADRQDDLPGNDAYFRRLTLRATDDVWRDPVVGRALGRAWRAVHGSDRKTRVPSGVDPIAATGDARLPAVRWLLRQVGGALVCAPSAEPIGGSGSPLGVVEFREPAIALQLGSAGGDLRVVEAGGEERFGLPAAVPGPAPVERPDWADDFGFDRFGPWADWHQGEVSQRFRWFAPGRFTMGSPKDEWGRWDDEPQHEVEVTRGYWLADTPCTQELWIAVTGRDPSRRGAGRPVTGVSFRDVESFLRKVGESTVDDGTSFRLPTEAEWEMACRAGTTAASYAGDFDEGSAASVLAPIGWYAGNAGRTVHSVAKLAPNPAGLFDMLGNVDEWCADAIGSLDDLQGIDAVDPVALGGSRRVLRGGSWDDGARHLRAAFRDASLPGARDVGLGFRLARGQEVRSSESGVERGAGRAVDIPRGRRPSFHVVTDRGRWGFESLVQPDWAHAFGRDKMGLWADLDVEGVTQRLRWVTPGRFLMGSPESEEGRYGEEDLHEVVLSRGYWLADSPCTQALWVRVMGSNPSQGQQGLEHPVASVSHGDARSFCEALSSRIGSGERVFRLPTEAEWEHACRAGTTTPTYHPEGPLDGLGWHTGNSDGGTHPVRQRRPNSWGLYDMLGNVHEWCLDHVEDVGDELLSNPAYRDGAWDPICLEGSRRVVRGGSWLVVARSLRAAFRLAYLPEARDVCLGFRLARGQK